MMPLKTLLLYILLPLVSFTVSAKSYSQQYRKVSKIKKSGIEIDEAYASGAKSVGRDPNATQAEDYWILENSTSQTMTVSFADDESDLTDPQQMTSFKIAPGGRSLLDADIVDKLFLMINGKPFFVLKRYLKSRYVVSINQNGNLRITEAAE